MPISTRGKKRDQLKAVAITNSLYYGFATKDLAAIAGISSSDIIALGQKDTTALGAGALVVYGAKAPRPGVFRKAITNGQQDSATAFGDASTATTIATAFAAGWKLQKPIKPGSVGGGKRMRAIAVEVSNGLKVICYIPKEDLTSGDATLLGWETSITAADIKKLVRGANNIKAARVSKTSDAGLTLTYPCATDKIGDATTTAGGYSLTSGELVG